MKSLILRILKWSYLNSLQREFDNLDDVNKWGKKNEEYESHIDLKQELKNLNMVIWIEVENRRFKSASNKIRW